MSDLYCVSLDELLRGDQDMIKHLEESTDVVTSNKKLITAIIVNILFLVVMIAFSNLIPNNYYFLAGIFSLAIISSSALLYQIINRI